MVGPSQRLVTIVSLLGLATGRAIDAGPRCIRPITRGWPRLHQCQHRSRERHRRVRPARRRHADAYVWLAVHRRWRLHGEVIGSQDALRITADGRYLLAVAAGSNGISVLRADEGSPASSRWTAAT